MQKNRVKNNLTFLGVFLLAIVFAIGGFLGFGFSSKNNLGSTSAQSTVNAAIKYDANNKVITDNSVFSVKKVLAQDMYTTDTVDEDTALHQETDENGNVLTEEIIYNSESDIPFVMLNTLEQAQDPPTREAVYIEFGVTGAEIRIFTVRISLNGTNIYNNDWKDATTDLSSQNQYFKQYIHGLTPSQVSTGSNGNALHDSYLTRYLKQNVQAGESSAGDPVESVEGLYDIQIQYRFGNESAARTAKFKFYLITQSTYDQMNQAPTFDYTEKLSYTAEGVENEDGYAKKHYFKYTNLYTSKNTGGTFSNPELTIYNTTDTLPPTYLYYPTLSYNPEKYKISFTKTLYNSQLTYYLDFTTEYNANNEEYGLLTITEYQSNKLIHTATRRLTKEPDGYVVGLKFMDVGEYEFTKTCILRTGVGQYVEANSIFLSDDNLLKKELLSITGFQAKYAEDGSGDSYFDNSSYDTDINGNLVNAYLNDFTFLNPNFVTPDATILPGTNNVDLSTYNPSANIVIKTDAKLDDDGNVIDNDNICHTKISSTNQAPVWFEYNATLNVNKNASWYIYYDTKGNRETHEFTKATYFNKAGTYVVNISFNNPVYTGTEGTNTSQDKNYFNQLFVFEITNVPPVVTINTTDATNGSNIDISANGMNTLELNGYTNKNVYLSWNKEGPFDTKITATYTLKNFDGTYEVSPESNTPFYGFVSRTLNGITTVTNKNATTVCTRNGIYTVTIYYTNSKQSFLSYSFIIDKEEISGIKALEVNNSTKALQDADPDSSEKYNLRKATISDTTALGFNLTTTKSFVWTWDTKASGAEITAQYTQATLDTISNFAPQIIENSDDVWVTANGEFGNFLTLMPYLYTKVTEDNANQLVFSQTQICSSPSFNILLLSDSAGNKAIFITIIENTTPEIIQQTINSTTPQNLSIISETTKFTWGTHKAISIKTSTTKTDIVDLLDETNEQNILTDFTTNFSPYDRIINSLNSFVVNNKIIVPIEEVEFTGSGGSMGGGSASSDSTVKNVVFSRNGNATIEQTYVWIVVDKTTEYCTYLSTSPSEPFSVYQGTKVYLNTNRGEATEANYPEYYTFTINLKDISGNEMLPRTVEVNFDKSRGTIFSHWGAVANDDITDSYGTGNVDRAKLNQHRSTNRQFVTFSFRQQESGSLFEVEKVVLKFYQLTYDVNSSNYPYSEEYKEEVLYDVSKTNDLFNVIYKENNGTTETYYHSSALKYLNYSSSFGSNASQDGKYEITRYYNATRFENATEEEKEGDVANRTYTFYVDRTKILSSSIDNDIKLTMGYEKGSSKYGSYTEYGGYTFNSFSRSIINEKEEWNKNFKIDDVNEVTPSEYPVITTNILPIGASLLTKTSPSLGIEIANKFQNKNLISVDDAENIMQKLVDKYQSSNMMVLVQYFKTTGLNYQSLYSHFMGEQNEVTTGQNRVYNLSKLTNAFSATGNYRVFIFDLSNINGTLQGTFNDIKLFEETSYKPNYLIINFSIKNQAPTITFQQKTGSSQYVSTKDFTKSDNVRFTFSDGTNEYLAKIAYNDVKVQRTTYSIYNESGTKSATVTINNPVWVTDDEEFYNEKISGDPTLNIIYSANYEILNKSLKDILAELGKTYENLSDFTETSNNYAYLKKLVDGFGVNGKEERFEYYIYLPQIPNIEGTEIQMDGEYDVFYQYIGNGEVESLYAATAFKGSDDLYIDNTPPYKTLQKLIQEDKYLKTTNLTNTVLNSMFDYNNKFLETYAFAVKSTWRPTSSEYGKTEAGEFYYVRGPYDKYDYSTTEYQQTAVPGTPAYNNPSYAIQFSETSNLFARYSYGLTSYPFAAGEGYYDIIEKDEVGNYRVYSVYVKTSSNAIMAKSGDDIYQISELLTGSEPGSTIICNDTNVDQFGDTSPAQTINIDNLTIDQIITKDRWFTIQYRLISSSSSSSYTTFSVTPATDINEYISVINQAISDTIANNKYLIGSKIEFIISNRVGNDIKFYVKTPGQQLLPTFTQVSPTTFRMQMPSETISTKIVSFEAKLSDGSAFTMPEPISTNPTTYLLNYPESGNYVFNFVDNFGRTYRVTHPVDTSLVKELIFDEGATVQTINGVPYTLGNTTFKYQSATFKNISIEITNKDDNNTILKTWSDTNINDLLNDINSYFVATIDENTGIAQIKFNAIANTHYQYKIDIDDGSASNKHTFTFATYTYLPSILLTDTSGVPIWEEMSEKTTSKKVVISWEDISDKQFNPRVSLQFPDGTTKEISSGFVAEQEGTYVIRILSDLGVSVSHTTTFNIHSYEISIFGVYLNGELLTPHQDSSTYTFMFKGEEVTKSMTQYFFGTSNNSASNWDNIRPTRNEDKDLDMELVASLGNTRIYYVYGSTSHVISEFYAITMVPLVNTSLTTMTINDESQTQTSSKVITLVPQDEEHALLHPANQTCSICAPEIIIKWNTAYTDSSYSTANPMVYGNFIFLDLYYNNQYVDTYTDGAISLTSSGTYTINIRNYVNQQHMFNTTYSSYTLTVLYDIIYKVNDSTPISNAIYNTPVSISLHDTSYYTMTSFDVKILKNNVELSSSNYTVKNNVYTFSDAGVYKVLMSVRLRGSTTMLYGEANFVILNNKESRTAYEFTKISGYEIIKVEKQNYEGEWEEITTTLNNNGANKIYNLLLSETTTGLGKYKLTIKTSAKELIPSQTFEFEVWINNETPILSPSREFGTNATSSVTIEYNEGLIYKQIGNCSIVVNGNTVAEINEENSTSETPKNFTLSNPNTYLVQVYTESGQLVLSQRVTIDVPLNTASIILIVVACLVVVGITLTFFLLRNKMKVR